jgi:hypothetical protein
MFNTIDGSMMSPAAAAGPAPRGDAAPPSNRLFTRVSSADITRGLPPMIPNT